VKLYVRFFTFFFKIQKNMTFYVFLSCCTRFPEQWLRPLLGTYRRIEEPKNLNSQHAGTGATWRINTKTLSTCSGQSRGGAVHVQLVWTVVEKSKFPLCSGSYSFFLPCSRGPRIIRRGPPGARGSQVGKHLS